MKLKMPNFITKNKKRSIIIGIVLLLVLVLLVARSCWSKKDAGMQIEYTEYTVGKNNIRVVISGSGIIEANEQYDITSLVTGDVLTANFEEGDIVEEGAVLYEIDVDSIENSIERAKNSLETAKMSYEDALEDVENLNVKATCSGVITNVYVKDGDSVNKGTKIADVVDSSVMILTIPFNTNDADRLYIGQSVTVELEPSSYSFPLTGTISRISTGSTTSSTGVSVKMVEIEVENPGTIPAGQKAIAYTSEYACNEAGTFDVNEQRTVTAEVSGTLDWVAIGVGDKVSEGQKVAQISSRTVINTARRSQLSYNDAQLNLDNLYKDMDNYTITAPIGGTVMSKTTKAGDKLDNTNKSTTMAVIADMSKILFTINVDELDIAQLKEGQSVTITADALEGRRYTGYIDSIDYNATSSNGVTTYPVTVVVENPEGLVLGYTVDAEITVAEATDVLCVPVSAVMRGNMVAVKSSEAPKEEKSENNQKGPQGGPAFGQQLPEGYVLKKVEIGVSNADYVEIVSGLSEGDIILIQQIQTSQSLQNMVSNAMSGAGNRQGGFGGGAPSGGYGGGAPSGRPSGGGMGGAGR